MKTILYLFFIVTMAISCAPAYTPNIVNTPLLSKEGEFQASVGTGTSGIDPQFAYAITENIGIMLNASYANRSDTNLANKNYHKHSFAEAGFGYTLHMGNAGRFEVYGGGGVGKVNAIFNQDVFYGRADATYTRIFIQPSIGATTDVFDGAFTTRLIFVNVNNSNPLLNSNRFDPFLEPTLTAKVGWRYIKMMFQLGFSVPLTNNYRNYNYQPFMFSIGLAGKIPGKKKSTTE